jgi:alkaline phosphatase
MRIKWTLTLGVLLASAVLGTPLQAQTIYPIDRATMLAGARFDLKVEFPGVIQQSHVRVTVNGIDHATALGRTATFMEKEDGIEASALLLRDVVLDQPGTYTVVATDGKNSAQVVWEVYRTDAIRQAKNVILFIGDGMSVAHRTAARMLSEGITEGKYHGNLAMDAMPHMALLGTAGVDSVITDSANSAHTYTTGHKSSVNALGVYADRTKNTLDDPKVETITSLVKRKHKMAVGIVTDAEVQDATPAAMVAHTRRRADKAEITGMFFDSGVEVLLGGGSAYFLPKATAGSKRKDDLDYITKFKQAGYTLVIKAGELQAVADDPHTTRLLGLFHTGNMDGVLDRKFLKKGTVDKFPDQPDLVDMTEAALKILSRHENGFLLMVEAGLIDKYSHPLDWERAVMDTIMLDQAVAVAKDFAAKNPSTLVLVTADHSHGLSIVGTVDDNVQAEQMRDKVGLYDKAGYPNYTDANGDGYPDTLDVSKRLAIFFSNFPDYYETFRVKTDGPFTPAVKQDSVYVANEKYRDVPGAMLRTGILPRTASTGVHTGEDVILTAMGPGAEQIAGFMDNTELFRVIANALALGDGKLAQQ